MSLLLFSNTFKSKDEVAELLTELRQSNVSRTLPEAYARLKSHTIQQSESEKDVFIISDFQRSTIGDLELLRIDSSDQIFVSPILYDETKNLFIDSIYLSNPFLVANEKNHLNVIIRNSGFEEAKEVPIKLFINDIQSASAIRTIPAGATELLSFEISYNLNKVNNCRINFEDYPVTFDNDFYFVLKLENKINILEIRPDNSTTPVEQVFGNSNLFNFTYQEGSNIDYSLIRLHDLVVVNGLQSIDNSLSLELKNYIRQGGSLFIIPAEDPDLASYKDIVPSFSQILGDSLKANIAMPDLSDPFYENIFESSNDRIEMPVATPILSWRSQQMDLLKMRNDLHFLSAFRSEGTIFTLASPLTDLFTTFHRHAIFVPVMYRIAAMSKRVFDKSYYSINEPTISLRLDSLDKRDIFLLSNEQSELIPNQRISANELILEMPKNTLVPGFYDLKNQDKNRGVLAFNLEKAESFLEQMSLDNITTLLSAYDNVTINSANDADIFSNEVKKNKFGVPLWKYAIIVSLIFLLAEVLLIRFL